MRFRPLDSEEIRRYVASGEPFDKAGAYGIQGRAAIFVEEIRGPIPASSACPFARPPCFCDDSAIPYEAPTLPTRRTRRQPSDGPTLPAMSEEFLINFTPQETRVALMQQGVVQELHIERTDGRGIVGNVYLGRVVRVLPGMQSAFIDIGLERTAFLHVADIWAEKQRRQKPTAGRSNASSPRARTLMVQVLKDPIGTKGARLSTQISLAGRLLVYLPQEKHIGISQRIEDEAEREQLRERIQQLLPRGRRGGGYIVRTMAENASDAELAADIAYLRRLWRKSATARRMSPAADACCTTT